MKTETTTINNIVQHDSPTRGPVSIQSAINRTLRYIDKSRQHWAGTPQEFRNWAAKQVAGRMNDIASQLCCQTSDVQIVR